MIRKQKYNFKVFVHNLDKYYLGGVGEAVSMGMGGLIAYFTVHVNSWSFCQTRYFTYIFSSNLIRCTQAQKRLNSTLDWMLSYVLRSVFDAPILMVIPLILLTLGSHFFGVEGKVMVFGRKMRCVECGRT